MRYKGGVCLGQEADDALLGPRTEQGEFLGAVLARGGGAALPDENKSVDGLVVGQEVVILVL